jgi:hypothetical protein
MITFLIAAGLMALAIGAFIIARARMIGAGANAGAIVASARLDMQEERGIATRYGFAIMALGAGLAILGYAGFVLSPASAAILFLLVVAFLFAHHNYAKDQRMGRHERAAGSDGGGR